MLRTGLESVGLSVAEISLLLAPLVAQLPQVIASGGALSNSKLWTQILSDTLGEPLAIFLVQKVSARCTAFPALCSLCLVKTLVEFPSPIREPIEPDLAAHEVYRAALQE